MNNIRLYVYAIILSVLLIIPSLLLSGPFVTMLSGIGCSGFAAAIMAICLERADNRRSRQRIETARKLYFCRLNNELKMLMARIIWFEKRIDDPAFDWEKDTSFYSSLLFMISANKASENKTISFENAVATLKEIGNKYNLDSFSKLPEKQKDTVRKMFQIIAYSGRYLLAELNRIKEDRLLLQIEGYISNEDIEKLLFDFSTGIGVFSFENKNYQVGIKLLIDAAIIIGKIGNYNDDISLQLQGTIQLNEL